VLALGGGGAASRGFIFCKFNGRANDTCDFNGRANDTCDFNGRANDTCDFHGTVNNNCDFHATSNEFVVNLFVFNMRLSHQPINLRLNSWM